MKKERRILHKLFAVLGLWIIVFDLLCPFPSMLGVSGLTWRLIIGLVSGVMIFICIWKIFRIDSKECV